MSSLETLSKPEASGLGRRVVRGIAWSQIGILVQTGLLFLFSVLVARTLTPTQKGVFDVYTALMGVLVLVSQLGLNFALMKFAPEAGTSLDAPRRRALLLRMVRDRVLVVAVLGGGLASLHTALAELLAFQLLEEIWELVVLALLGNQVLEIALAALQAGLRLRAFWALQSLRVALNIAGLALWVMVLKHVALQNLIALMAMTSLFSAGVGLAYALRVNPPAPSGVTLILPSQREVYRFALSAWLISMTAFALSNQSDLLLINLLLKDTAQVAYYNIAYLLSTQTIALLSGWVALALPALTAALERRGAEGMHRAWMPFAQFELLTFMPTLLLLARIAPWAIELLFGEAYVPASPFLSALAILFAVVHLPTSIPHHLLLAVGHVRTLLILRTGCGLLSVGLNVLLIPLLGVWGTVIATTTAFGLAFKLEFWVARRILGIVFPGAFALRVTASAAVAMLSTLWIDPKLLSGLPIPVALLIAIGLSLVQGMLVFALLLIALKPLTHEDLEALTPLPAKVRLIMRWFMRPPAARRW